MVDCVLGNDFLKNGIHIIYPIVFCYENPATSALFLADYLSILFAKREWYLNSILLGRENIAKYLNEFCAGKKKEQKTEILMLEDI